MRNSFLSITRLSSFPRVMRRIICIVDTMLISRYYLIIQVRINEQGP
jgi:hypothetical protein